MQGGYNLLRTSDTSIVADELQFMDYNSQKVFIILWIFVQIIGLLNVILVLLWTIHFLGGFAWQEDPLHEFNYHPLFAVLGLVVLNGNGLLTYRVLRRQRKKSLKLLHSALFTLAFIATVFSLKTVFDSHDYRTVPIANMYSLHSWIGLGTVVLFAIQFTFGFVSFLYPGINLSYRRICMPFHQFLGTTIFALAVASCQSGITEKAKGALKEDYQNLPRAAYVANFLGVFLTIYGILVIYLVSMPQFKRRPLQEENCFQFELHESTS